MSKVVDAQERAIKAIAECVSRDGGENVAFRVAEQIREAEKVARERALRDAGGWEQWALDMCTLLDRIETTTDEDDIRDLCQTRFDLAKRHGLEIQIVGEASSVEH